MRKQVIVVGGGPAGMMAAIRAVQCGAEVTLIEKNNSLAAKLMLTGKGRCNLTNTSSLDSFLEKFGKNGNFLRDSFKILFNKELMKFFEQRGVSLKVERQNRVFPASDRGSSIKNVLTKELAKSGVQVLFGRTVTGLNVEDQETRGIRIGKMVVNAYRVIIATGGMTYPNTGSTGDGYKFCQCQGHSLVQPQPALVPLVVQQKQLFQLTGLVLKNIRLRFQVGKKVQKTEIGELLFTDFGISGPLVITHSGEIIRTLKDQKSVPLWIDIKPGLTMDSIQAKFAKEVKTCPKKLLKNYCQTLLPKKFIKHFLQMIGINQDKQMMRLTKGDINCLIDGLKGFPLDVIGYHSLDDAMVTQGGISLKEIDPRTMESKLIKGLYFGGEIIDVHGDTGGYNLQAAFSTGYLAGESAAKYY